MSTAQMTVFKDRLVRLNAKSEATLLHDRALEIVEKARKGGGGFNSAQHPRHPSGPKGGQFRSKGGAAGAAIGTAIGGRLGAALGATTGAPYGLSIPGMAVGASLGAAAGGALGHAAGTVGGFALDVAIPRLESMASKVSAMVPDLKVDVRNFADGMIEAGRKFGLSEDGFNAVQDFLMRQDSSGFVRSNMTEKFAAKTLLAKGDYAGARQYRDLLRSLGSHEAAGQLDIDLGIHKRQPTPQDEAAEFLAASLAYGQLKQAGMLS